MPTEATSKQNLPTNGGNVPTISRWGWNLNGIRNHSFGPLTIKAKFKFSLRSLKDNLSEVIYTSELNWYDLQLQPETMKHRPGIEQNLNLYFDPVKLNKNFGS